MKPSEHKTVQSRILAYAQELGWMLVFRAEAEVLRPRSELARRRCLMESNSVRTSDHE